MAGSTSTVVLAWRDSQVWVGAVPVLLFGERWPGRVRRRMVVCGFQGAGEVAAAPQRVREAWAVWSKRKTVALSAVVVSLREAVRAWGG